MQLSLTSRSKGAFAWWTLFAVLCFLMVVVGLETALHFLGSAIDGPFQLYNALRRIWGGQRGGVDYQFFHGLGIPYAHYLQFKLLGGGFIASEITRELTSVVLYPLTVVVVLRFFIKDWVRVAAWSAIIMAVSIALRITSVLIAVNSLLGIRSTIPVLLPVVLCLPVRRPLRVALTGVAIGLALLLGSEQGLAVILALVLTTALLAIRSTDRIAVIVDTLASIALGVVTLMLGLIAIGGVDGMRGALVYNFKLVPMDQYWYFGAPPNLFLSRWQDVPRMLLTIPRIPLTILAGLIAVVFCSGRLLATTNTAEERRQFGLTILAFYGLISCASLLGTYVHAYVQPLLRVLLLLTAIYLDRVLPERDARLGRAPVGGASRSLIHIGALAVFSMLVLVPSMYATIGVTIPHFFADHVFRGVGAVYTRIWPETITSGQAILDSRRNPDGTPPTLWSTYSGLLEARNGLFNPSVDYIIHALGPENRAKYVADFKRVKPRLVQTVLPTYTQYESWIEGTSWDFYSELLQNYRVIASTPWSLFWERQPTPSTPPQEVWSAKIPSNTNTVELPAAPGNDGIVLLQAELTYTVKNPLRVLPIVGTLPRYLVAIENGAHAFPTTLNPYVTTSRFPIVAYRGKPVRLTWNAFSLLPGAHVEVSSVKLSFFPLADANLPWLLKLFDKQTGVEPE